MAGAVRRHAAEGQAVAPSRPAQCRGARCLARARRRRCRRAEAGRHHLGTNCPSPCPSSRAAGRGNARRGMISRVQLSVRGDALENSLSPPAGRGAKRSEAGEGILQISEQTASADNANAAMRRYWNEVAGPRWVERAEIQEARNIEVAQILLRGAKAQPGERVLDVGCGPGATALPLAAAVGTSGHVTGVDIAEPMLGLLQRRVAERGIANLTPLLADAQTHAFEPASVDLLTSRFGVMLFAGHL